MSIKAITTDDLRHMDDEEGLILQGCGGDLQEWLDGINELFTENGILKDDTKFEDTARLMLANSEFLIMLNQSATDREELAKLLNLSDTQLGYITNVPAGCGLIRCAGNLVPFTNNFPKDTQLYRLMTTKPDEQLKG